MQTTLVNCAGVLAGGAFGTPACNLDNFMFNFNTNTKVFSPLLFCLWFSLTGVKVVFEMMHHATPHLKAAGKDKNPSIVNISSVNGTISFPGVSVP